MKPGPLPQTIAAIVLAFGLSASADSGGLSAPDLAKIRTVAIISAVGQTFSFEKVGAGTFEWFGPPDTRYLEVSDWNIDDAITRQITAALAKRITVKKASFELADFSTWDYASLRRQIFQLNDDPNIDAYILVLRDWHWDSIGYSVHDVQGLGLYRRDVTGGEQRDGIFAAYRIVVVDANTGDIYASRAVTMPDGEMPAARTLPSLWPRTPNDLSEMQRATLQAEIAKLIGQTLPRTLAEMKLTK